MSDNDTPNVVLRTYGPMSAHLLRMAELVPPTGLLCLTENSYLKLERERGTEWAARFLATLSQQMQRPIYVHLSSNAVAITPPEWTRERTMGWLAPHAEEIERTFGVTITRFEEVPHGDPHD